MKRAMLDRYMYDFLVNYDTIDTSNIWNIHIYLMIKHYMI